MNFLIVVACNTFKHFPARKSSRIDSDEKCLVKSILTGSTLLRPTTRTCLRSISLPLPALGRTRPATVIVLFTALLLAFCSGGKRRACPVAAIRHCQTVAGPSGSSLYYGVWLARENIPVIFNVIPMVFIIIMTAQTMGLNMVNIYAHHNWFFFSMVRNHQPADMAGGGRRNRTCTPSA